MFKRQSLLWLLVLIGVVIHPLLTHAFDTPINDGFVTIDPVLTIISQEQEQAIETLLMEYQKATSNEIAILFANTLQGEDCNAVAVEVGRNWGVGDSDKNNGIMLLAGYEDRKICIATGYGLEGPVPDIVAKGIIDDVLTPHFRDGKFGEGLLLAVEHLQKHIGGEYTADKYAGNGDDFSWLPMAFFFFMFFFEWIIAILQRVKGWWLGGIFGGVGGIILVIAQQWWLAVPALIIVGLLLDYVVSSHYKKHGRRSKFWAGGNWGPSRSGSRGSSHRFGGGSFGGGGASGGW